MADPTNPGPPIIPGPQYQPPPTAPQPQYYAPAPPPARDPNAGLRTAGTVAIWTWVAIVAAVILVIGGCIAFCLISGLVGLSQPGATP